MRMFLASVVLAAVAFAAVTVIIRSGESRENHVLEPQEVVKRIEEEQFGLRAKWCRETSVEAVYRCKLVTGFRYAEIGEEFEDDWCVGADGRLMSPIKSRTDSGFCD